MLSPIAVAERRGTVDAEGEPELQRAKRPRVLERAVDGVQAVVRVQHVRLVVHERALQRRPVAHQHDAARLRQVQPLVGIDRHRVGAVESREEAGRVARAAAGRP